MNIQDTTGICLNLFAKWQMKLLFEVATNLHFWSMHCRGTAATFVVSAALMI